MVDTINLHKTKISITCWSSLIATCSLYLKSCYFFGSLGAPFAEGLLLLFALDCIVITVKLKILWLLQWAGPILLNVLMMSANLLRYRCCNLLHLRCPQKWSYPSHSTILWWLLFAPVCLPVGPSWAISQMLNHGSYSFINFDVMWLFHKFWCYVAQI